MENGCGTADREIRSRIWLVALLMMAPLAAEASGAAGYQTVSQVTRYGPRDKDDKVWRAQLLALDRCHEAGFVDAQLTVPPHDIWADNGPDRC
jgi:hypothetical protein